jgi:transposase
MAEKKQQPTYTAEFKAEIVKLVETGRTPTEVASEYGIAKSSVATWCKQSANSGSFKRKENISGVEKEISELKKKNNRLEMEIDILKKAAVIMLKN